MPAGSFRRRKWLEHAPGLRQDPDQQNRSSVVLNLTPQVNAMSERIQSLRADGGRVIVGLAGAPGSGKSTLAEELARRLNDQKCLTSIVPQDGFHLDNQVLEDRNQLPRKGAAFTFDGAGFVHLVRRLKDPVDVVVPVFDRTRDLAVAGARIVPADAEVIIVEGNYLLFDEAPWRDLAALWSLSVRLEVPTADLRARLIQRWLGHGLSRTAATRRAESNDIPNALSVVEKALPADMTLTPDGRVF